MNHCTPRIGNNKRKTNTAAYRAARKAAAKIAEASRRRNRSHT